MVFQDIVLATQKYFPNLHIKYKDTSPLMQVLKLFASKDFMHTTTTIHNTIYFPSTHFVKLRPITSIVMLLHEVVNMHSSKKNAYLSSLYVIWQLSKKMHFTSHLEKDTKNFVHRLHKPWHMHSLEKEFKIIVEKIQSGSRPFENKIFDILDDLIANL